MKSVFLEENLNISTMRHFYLLVCFFSISVFGQNLKVSDDILSDLKTIVRFTETDTFTFRVALPDNYDSEKTYPLLLGLSGGEQSLEIVDYCYAAYFQSGYFKDYIVIMPVNTNNKNFADYPAEKINSLINEINATYKTNDNWFISGTSNGGTAAFNFVAAQPNQFSALFVAPGILSENIILSNEWSHLNVVMAYGDLDDEKVIKPTKDSAKRIKKEVKNFKLLALEGQGHILAISFNIDRLYDVYFIEFKDK